MRTGQTHFRENYCSGIQTVADKRRQMDNPQETFECTRCNKLFFSDGFKVDRLGRRLKTCLECNARSKAERERYKCPHGRQKKSCRDCGGSSFCLHEHLKAQCRICSPKSSKASAQLAQFRDYQKLPSWPVSTITAAPTRGTYDIVAPRLDARFTKLRDEGRVRPDEYDALMAKRKEWEGPPKQAPQLTDSEVAEILAPIYAEMEPQKPPEVKQRNWESCDCFFPRCSHNPPVYYN